MVVLRNCWSPCYWYDNVEMPSIVIAGYTMAASVVLIIYTGFVMGGGESAYFYLPYFETDVRNSMQYVGGFVIAFLVLFFFASMLLIWGIKIELRGLFLPWFSCMALVILFQAIFGLWLIGGYYIYLMSVFVALVDWLLMSYNIYCFLCVYSQFQILTLYQSPNIELLYP